MLRREDSPEMLLLKQALEDGRHLTKYSIADLLGIHPKNASRYIKILRLARLVHVSGWQQTGNVGPYHPVITWGKGEDTPKPGSRERNTRRVMRAHGGITWNVLFGRQA